MMETLLAAITTFIGRLTTGYKVTLNGRLLDLESLENHQDSVKLLYQLLESSKQLQGVCNSLLTLYTLQCPYEPRGYP